jgi:hypothetical protein
VNKELKLFFYEVQGILDQMSDYDLINNVLLVQVRQSLVF